MLANYSENDWFCKYRYNLVIFICVTDSRYFSEDLYTIFELIGYKLEFIYFS